MGIVIEFDKARKKFLENHKDNLELLEYLIINYYTIKLVLDTEECWYAEDSNL